MERTDTGSPGERRCGARMEAGIRALEAWAILPALLLTMLLTEAALPATDPSDSAEPRLEEAAPAAAASLETAPAPDAVQALNAVPAADTLPAPDTLPASNVDPLRAPVIGIPIHLPEVPGVKEPIFSILIGLVETDTYGTLTKEQLEHHLRRSNKKSKLPYQLVHAVTRLPQGADRPTAEIEVLFDEDLRLPIPYSILGYNPGSFRASERCLFQEWDLGDVVVNHRESKDGVVQEVPVMLQKVHLFGLADGTVELDIDGWVDSMMGGNLDDTEIVGLVLCLYNGEWHGVAMGYNHDRKGRSGALSFREDKVVFPSPPEIKTIGRTMRSWVESLMASAEK